MTWYKPNSHTKANEYRNLTSPCWANEQKRANKLFKNTEPNERSRRSDQKSLGNSTDER